MTDPIASEVEQLRAAAEAARAAQARAQAQLEAAGEDEKRILSKMQEDFGVSSLEDAQALLTKIEAELQAEIDKTRDALARAQRPEEDSQ